MRERSRRASGAGEGLQRHIISSSALGRLVSWSANGQGISGGIKPMRRNSFGDYSAIAALQTINSDDSIPSGSSLPTSPASNFVLWWRRTAGSMPNQRTTSGERPAWKPKGGASSVSGTMMYCRTRALSSRCCWQNWHRAAGSTLTRRASARRPLPLRGRGDHRHRHCPGPRAARIVPPAHQGGHHASARTRPVLCRVTGRAGHGAGPHSARRPARGSRSARSDPRLVLCRTHRVLRHLRQAVRHRRQAQHRPGAGDRLRMEGSRRTSSSTSATACSSRTGRSSTPKR